MTYEDLYFYRATGPHGFLSNLFIANLDFEGRTFDCAERAYQYGKPKDTEVAEWLVEAPSPSLCAVAAHALLPFHIKENWQEIKLPRMREVIKAKFTQSPALRDLLLKTSPRKLIERSADAFWGDGKNGNGMNTLGNMLMETRDSFGK